MASNAIPVHPLHPVSRFSTKQRKRRSAKNIFVYNRRMGGVDRADQNISLYRVAVRGKK